MAAAVTDSASEHEDYQMPPRVYCTSMDTIKNMARDSYALLCKVLWMIKYWTQS